MSAATYAYCVVAAASASTVEKALKKAPRGVPGAGPPRVLACGEGRFLVAADAPLDRFGEEAMERGLRDLDWVSSCAVAHEALIEHFLAADAVLPMKLFTLFRDDASALAQLARDKRAVERALGRVRGCAEWGVRVAVDAARAAAHAERESDRAAGGAATGAAFLLRKKTLVEAARAVSVEGRRRVDEAHQALATAADDARTRPPADAGAQNRLLLDAAYLVPAKRARAFRAAAAKWAKQLAAAGLALTLTGPWPPYHFVGDAR